MISEKEVEAIANLADITLQKEELANFTSQFNAILDYFEVLDRVREEACGSEDLVNVFREDEVMLSLPQEDVLTNAGSSEDGFIRAPRVM
jgi:aspartyl-tRNA(Asn)/glutamyl-tRNA(Gln) amidotransferase subunit C